MQDRAPTKPNRYAVYDDAHNFLRYEYHERADEPTQVGDALNKANLLPDDVATALGLTGNPQVKDALEKIKTLVDGNTALANSKAKVSVGSYSGTGTYGVSNPNSIALISNCKVFMLFFFHKTSNNLIFGLPDIGFAVDISRVRASYDELKIATTLGHVLIRIKKENGILSWYSAASADEQLNVSGINYSYLMLD